MMSNVEALSAADRSVNAFLLFQLSITKVKAFFTVFLTRPQLREGVSNETFLMW